MGNRYVINSSLSMCVSRRSAVCALPAKDGHQQYSNGDISSEDRHNMDSQPQPTRIDDCVSARYPDQELIETSEELELVENRAPLPPPCRMPTSVLASRLRSSLLLARLSFLDRSQEDYYSYALALFIVMDLLLYSDFFSEYIWLYERLSSVWATGSQSKLSQEQLNQLQKDTHFDKKELQQWYKGLGLHFPLFAEFRSPVSLYPQAF